MAEKTSDTWVGQAITPPKGHLAACLVNIYPTGADMGRRYPLEAKRLVIGRGETADIHVQEHSVSRTHAAVELSDGQYYVLDQKSLNGTYINDKPARGACPLNDGDYIRVGNAIFRFLSGGNVEAEYHEEIYRMAIIDGLTQLHNRRYLMEFLERELIRAQRHERPLSVLIFDIDRFKTINDNYGHLCGDHVLREICRRIRPTVRREDLLARYGGEEFCMVLVEADRDDAAVVGERVRKLVESAPFNFESLPIPVTLSLGLASVGIGSETMSVEQLLRQADDNLYAAKKAGRNVLVG